MNPARLRETNAGFAWPSLAWTPLLLALFGCDQSLGGQYQGTLQVVAEGKGVPKAGGAPNAPAATVTVTRIGDATYRAEFEGCQFTYVRKEDSGAGMLLDGDCSCPRQGTPIGIHRIEHQRATLYFRFLAAQKSNLGCRYQFRGKRKP